MTIAPGLRPCLGNYLVVASRVENYYVGLLCKRWIRDLRIDTGLTRVFVRIQMDYVRLIYLLHLHERERSPLTYSTLQKHTKSKSSVASPKTLVLAWSAITRWTTFRTYRIHYLSDFHSISLAIPIENWAREADICTAAMSETQFPCLWTLISTDNPPV